MFVCEFSASHGMGRFVVTVPHNTRKTIFLRKSIEIFTEIQYWDKRLTNLKNINQQLQNGKVYKMIRILETTNSAYYPGFKNVYDNVQSGKFFDAMFISNHDHFW